MHLDAHRLSGSFTSALLFPLALGLDVQLYGCANKRGYQHLNLCRRQPFEIHELHESSQEGIECLQP